MGLKDVLAKIRLLEVEETPDLPKPVAARDRSESTPRPAAGPSKPAAGTAAASPSGGRTGGTATTMEEILRTLPPVEIDEKALPATASDGADDGEPSFADIYRAAAIKDPAHGFGAYKVLEILRSDAFAGLDMKAKASALSGFLKMNPAGPVPIQDVIQDAVKRDQALDAFEALRKRKLETRAREVEQDNTRLQAEIDAVARKNRELMEASRQALEIERRRLADWLAKKRSEERKLYDAVSPFIDPNPVTLSGGPESPPSGPGTVPRS